MQTILIITSVILVSVIIYLTYVPSNLRGTAHNAGLNSLSFKYLILKSQKIDVEFFLKQYVKARQVQVPVSFNDLKEYYLSYPDKTENMVNILIKARRSGVKADINHLEKFELSGGDAESLIAAEKNVKNAEIDISRDVLETHSLYGGDIKIFVEIIIKAKKANLEINLQKLVEENLSDENMKKIVDTLIKIKKAGLYVSEKDLSFIKTDQADNNSKFDLRLSQQGILEHYRANIDVEKYASAMIKAKKAGVDIDKDALNIHYLTDGDIEKLVTTMIKAEKAGLALSQKEIAEHNIEGRDIGKIIKNLIKARRAGLDLSMDEMVEYYRINGNSDDFVIALLKDKEEHLGIGKKELEDHFLAGANVLDYVKARSLLKSNPDIGVTKDKINSHYLKGGNILPSLFAIMYAKQNGIDINANIALKIDLLLAMKKPVEEPKSIKDTLNSLDDVVRWAVNPVILNVEPSTTVVSKDGIQITPKLRVTLRGKFMNYLKGSDEQLIFGRINEAVTHEIAHYSSFKNVLNNLNSISENIIKRLLGKIKIVDLSDINKFDVEDEIKAQNAKEIKLNSSSAYEILDIKMYDIIIGKDTLAEFKTHHAEHEMHLAEIHLHERLSKAGANEAEAKVELLKAKA
ncbi:MAG: flotillin-like FloA family protein, partial [Bacteroidota bacterium]|nr:flotillin-like FloA family protein [Bacteroidota bacterium]